MAVVVAEDTFLHPVAERLHDCFCEALEASAPVLCCCMFYGAGVPWDDCSADGDREGMAWVRIVALDQYIISQGSVGCAPIMGWQAQLELGALRCAPKIDEDGTLPPCEDNSFAAWKASRDRAIMAEVVRCCDWPTGTEVLQGFSWRPVSGGGCQGGIATITVRLGVA